MGNSTCSVEGCADRVRARGWCNRHYGQWKRHGDPAVYKRGRADTPAADRFWPRVDADGDCWDWAGRVNRDGYGQFDVGGRTVCAHRWSYETLIGAIPDGLTVDHLCRNRRCVNPDHLEPVSRKENTQRGIVGWRNRAKTHCPQGHPYTPDNTRFRGNGRECRECGRAASNRSYARRVGKALTL